MDQSWGYILERVSEGMGGGGGGHGLPDIVRPPLVPIQRGGVVRGLHRHLVLRGDLHKQ